MIEHDCRTTGAVFQTVLSDEILPTVWIEDSIIKRVKNVSNEWNGYLEIVRLS